LKQSRISAPVVCVSSRRGGRSSPGFYLDVYTDAEDAFAVLDLVSDWLVDFSLNTGVHLHVIPLPHEAAAPRA